MKGKYEKSLFLKIKNSQLPGNFQSFSRSRALSLLPPGQDQGRHEADTSAGLTETTSPKTSRLLMFMQIPLKTPAIVTTIPLQRGDATAFTSSSARSHACCLRTTKRRAAFSLQLCITNRVFRILKVSE